MHEMVREFLEKKRQKIEAEKEKNKVETLISLGLYEVEYSPDGEQTSEYNLGKWDEEAGKTRYYKKVPVDVSEEEYEEIKKIACADSEKSQSQSNIVAKTLSVVAGLIWGGGFIAGIVLGNVEVTKSTFYNTYTDTEFSFAIALAYWASSFIIGTMMMGLAEIVKLLNDIKNKK